MAFRTKKERLQVSALGTVLAIILGVVGYLNRESILPKPTAGDAGLAAPARILIPESLPTGIFERDDFKALRRFGNVPVKPTQKGSTSLFNEL
jgi:hypothetical protein